LKITKPYLNVFFISLSSSRMCLLLISLIICCVFR